MRRLGRILLWTCLVLLAAGAAVALVLWRHWPWWAGAGLFLGLVGLCLGVRALRIHYRRRKEREFIRRVLDQDQAAIDGRPVQERRQLRDLEADWAEGIRLLQESHLGRRGNPLYTLPWFLVIGESGVGKTSAIQRAGLHSQIGEVRRSATLASTRNCSWWFFDRAIVLDTAGRYTIPLDPGPDQEEWGRFLALLAKYRRREPVNGVIVAVPADQLLDPGRGKLQEDAHEIRRRLDHLMKGLGARFPVYILVTKMDKVFGMAEFAGLLGERVAQAMGFTSENPGAPWRDVLRRAFETIPERLRRLRTVLVQQNPRGAAAALLFPRTFEELRPGLDAFLEPLFLETVYQETPHFRGIFFSSARQGGETLSEFRTTFGLPDPGGTARADQGGLFLNALFTTILPRDRHLHRPTREYFRWRALFRRTGFLAWLLCWTCCCGLLGMAYLANARAIRAFPSVADIPTALPRDPGGALLTLEHYRLRLVEMKAANHSWWILRFGLRQSLEVERRIESHYLRLLREDFLLPLDRELAERLRETSATLTGDALADSAGYLVTRIDLIQQWLKQPRLDPQHPPKSLAPFREATTGLLTALNPELTPELARLFADQYLMNLIWLGELKEGGAAWARDERIEKVAELQDQLHKLLERRDFDLRWAVNKWIPRVPDVQMDDFWGQKDETVDSGIRVSGAFTGAGRANILEFLGTLERVSSRPAEIASRLPGFNDWYRRRFYEAWSALADAMPAGAQDLGAGVRGERVALAMTTPDNPYFLCLARMAQEFKALEDPAPPPWAALVQQLEEARAAGVRLAEKDPSLLEQVEARTDKLLPKAKGLVDPKASERYQRTVAAGKLHNAYLDGLGALSPMLINPSTATTLLAECAGTGLPKDKNPFITAFTAAAQLSNLLGEAGPEGRIIWTLYRGPADYLLDNALGVAGNLLDATWKEQVVAPVAGAEGARLASLLFAKQEGLVWKFLDGPARPFLAKGPAGYAPRPILGHKGVALGGDFLAFLQDGAEAQILFQPSYSLSVEALPMEVNPQAGTRPVSSRLCLQCADPRTSCLENFNFPKEAVFRWEAQTCQDTTLTLAFPGFQLVHSWEGGQGFARFLADFQSGSRTFTAADFPGQEAAMRAAGLQWVRIGYRIKGAEPVLRYARSSHASLPGSIRPAPPTP